MYLNDIVCVLLASQCYTMLLSYFIAQGRGSPDIEITLTSLPPPSSIASIISEIANDSTNDVNLVRLSNILLFQESSEDGRPESTEPGVRQSGSPRPRPSPSPRPRPSPSPTGSSSSRSMSPAIGQPREGVSMPPRPASGASDGNGPGLTMNSAASPGPQPGYGPPPGQGMGPPPHMYKGPPGQPPYGHPGYPGYQGQPRPGYGGPGSYGPPQGPYGPRPGQYPGYPPQPGHYPNSWNGPNAPPGKGGPPPPGQPPPGARMGAPPPGGPPGYGGHRPPYPGGPPASYNGGYPPSSGYPGGYPPPQAGPGGDQQHSDSNNDRQKPVTPVTPVETTGPDGQPMHDESSQQSTLSQSSDNSGGRQTPKGNYSQVTSL